MECNEIRDMLSLYIDGELDEKDMQSVDEHIQNCEDCRKELEDYNKIIHVLHHMPEEEPPKGYCDRLHDKLLKINVTKKAGKRMRWVKYGSIAAAFVLVFAVYVSSHSGLRMGATKSENNMNYDTAQEPAEAPSEPQIANKGKDYTATAEESKNASGAITDYNRDGISIMTIDAAENKEAKIIKTGDINVKTENYNLFTNNLTEKVKYFGGFIEQSNTNVYSSYEKSRLMYGNFKLRVPQDKFYELINYLDENSEVYTKNIAETDVTKEYYEKDNKVKNLEAQEQHLREMFEKAQTIEEMLLIENELRRIRTEIDSLNLSLVDIDNRSSMSTLNIEVQEVLPANITLSDRNSVWDRARAGFINTVNGIINIGENLIIALVSLLPILVPVVIVILIVVYKIRKRKK